jgi:hypothetical protein
MKLIIKGKLATANEYIEAIGHNRYEGGALKKQETERVYWACKEQRLKPMILWREKERKHLQG